MRIFNLKEDCDSVKEPQSLSVLVDSVIPSDMLLG